MRILPLLLAGLFVARAENPWNAEKLSQPPKADWGATNELTQEVWYEGEPYMGKPTRIFAYIGRPEGKGPHTAIVLVQGGGGEAFRD